MYKHKYTLTSILNAQWQPSSPVNGKEKNFYIPPGLNLFFFSMSKRKTGNHLYIIKSAPWPAIITWGALLYKEGVSDRETNHPKLRLG